jgi:hypothetical protein
LQEKLAMRKLILIPIGFLLSLILSSYHGGAAYWGNINCTGAEKNNIKGCSMNGAGCHTNTASALIQMRIDLLDANNKIVTEYIPKQKYTIRLSAYNKRQDTLPTFGFQLLCMLGDTASIGMVNAGIFDTMQLGTDLRYTAAKSGIYNANIIEQNDRILASTGNGLYGSKYQVDVLWTAPDSGFGKISFWAVVNASNNDGHNGAAGGEFWNTKHVSYSEGVGPAAAIDASLTQANSVIQIGNDQIKIALSGIQQLNLMSLDGKQLPISWEMKNPNAFLIQSKENIPLGVYLIEATNKAGKTSVAKVLLGL